MHVPSINDPPIYPNDGPTVARPKAIGTVVSVDGTLGSIVKPGSVVEIGEGLPLPPNLDADLLRDALGALAKLPHADAGKQRVVVIDTEHRAFIGLDVNRTMIALADADIVGLTDIEARRVGFHPADRDALLRLHREGVLVADIPVESIRCAAIDNAAVRAKFRDFGARASDDVVPAKTLRRRQRLAERAARGAR